MRRTPHQNKRIRRIICVVIDVIEIILGIITAIIIAEITVTAIPAKIHLSLSADAVVDHLLAVILMNFKK